MPHVTIKLEEGRHLEIAYRDGTSDREVINQIWQAREYDLRRLRRWPDIQSLFASITRDGSRPLIIDAGANIGASPLFFAENYRGSHVIAIEPEQGNFHLLQANAQQAKGIECLQAALSSSDGEMEVFDSGWREWGFRAGHPGENGSLRATGQRVPTYTVASVIKKSAGAVPFIIKLDIEGGEADVFAKNTGWIDQFPVLIIELHDWMMPGSSNSKNFLTAIAPLGRDFVHIGENIYSIKN